MPNSLMFEYEKIVLGGTPNYDTKKDFWNRWWTRKIKTIDGLDGWYAQLDYLKEIIKTAKES